MARYLDGETAAFVEGRAFSWRTLFNRVADKVRLWRRRQQDRRELLEYLDCDFRAAADLGLNRHDVRAWASRPFWRE